MSEMTPREIVQELDKHIVGQDDAKRAVAIALRNRWRRMQVDEELRNEITPKNILIRAVKSGSKKKSRDSFQKCIEFLKVSPTLAELMEEQDEGGIS